MAKRYLGGGISFEQKDVYQEFSEDNTPTPSGSTTLAGLTDVDLTNPSDGQTLVYNATSGKWENGAGGGDIFETLGTISAATVPMTYDDVEQWWIGEIESDINVPTNRNFAGRNLNLKIGGQLFSVNVFPSGREGVLVDETSSTGVALFINDSGLALLTLISFASEAPLITDLSMEVYAPSSELAVFLVSDK